eukprot:gene170-62_t
MAAELAAARAVHVPKFSPFEAKDASEWSGFKYKLVGLVRSLGLDDLMDLALPHLADPDNHGAPPNPSPAEDAKLQKIDIARGALGGRADLDELLLVGLLRLPESKMDTANKLLATSFASGASSQRATGLLAAGVPDVPLPSGAAKDDDAKKLIQSAMDKLKAANEKHMSALMARFEDSNYAKRWGNDKKGESCKHCGKVHKGKCWHAGGNTNKDKKGAGGKGGGRGKG